VPASAAVPDRVAHESRYRIIGRPGHEESLSAGFVVSPHCNYKARHTTRPHFTLLYLLKGRGEYQCGGRNWELLPGALVLRPPGVVHSVLRSRAEQWCEFFMAYPDSVYSFLRELGVVSAERTVLNPGITRLTWVRLRSLLNNVPSDSGVSVGQLLAESQALLAHLVDMDHERREGGGEAAAVRKAREVLARDFDQPLDMPSVAASLGVGYEAFRKMFCRYQGLPPKEYRIRRRIDTACHLLTVGRTSVKETAVRLGYPDAPSFVKQFRRVMGMPPAAFRNLGRS
jgi:AraC-like DNA-binding protein/quercetin dioxygenase-like cupin family protein